jgi:Domain of unknown function (DUF1929)/Glyoxal oxidase N-terminus/Fibronectin type III domain/Galactose oxidase, central domain
MAKVARPPVLAAALASMLAGWLMLGPITPILRAQSDPSVKGSWSAVQTWPIVSVHASLLPTGKVVFYSYSDDPHLWDPSNGSIVAATKVGYNIFCSGLTLLADGRLFVGGGHISNNVGLNDASIYDGVTNTWSREPDMNAGRWYPTTTTLADGSVLVVSGDIDTSVHANPLPQVWTNGVWRDLNTAQLKVALYPFMLLAPNGKVFNAGPQQTSRVLDTTGTGTWFTGPASTGGNRSYGSAVMYEAGKVLIVGGNDPPRATAEKIDLNLPPPRAWQPAGTMASARRQLNATVLPDGTVLVTGGSSAAGFNNASGAVYTAELWDPAQPTANAFTTLASATRYRGYHSIALLLPDGRVLSSGGDNEPNAEVFSPPYLFKGARPAVASAPSNISYGNSFFVETPDATSTTAVTLVRLSAVTHSFNMNQRLVRLAFSQATGGLTVTAPSAGEIAPPGHYMLFLLNTAGVPSIARIVRLSNDALPLPAAPTDLSASAVSTSQINLSWTDNASNETGFRIERSSDGTSFTEISTVGANVTTYADTGLSASTQYWYRVRAYNGSGPSNSSNQASATTLAPPQPPAAPTDLNTAVVSSSQINLTWSDNASNETGYQIERSPDGTSFTEISTVGANVTTYADTGLSASTQHWYRVRAYNGAGLSNYSNSASGTTQPPPPPSAPTGLLVTRQSRQFTLAWTDTSNNETGFAIQRSADGLTFSQIATVAANVVRYVDTSPGSSKFVYYRVRAFNAAGNSAFSITVKVRNE